jgi:AcrR family transcriptional regulator
VARKVGLTVDDVVDAAELVADRDGLDAVSLATVAGALGVKAPSLYAHVAGLDGLHRALGRRGAVRIGAAMAEAADGEDDAASALRAIAVAYRRFSHDHPGLYAAMLPAPDPATDPDAAVDYAAAITAPAEVLSRFGLPPERTIDAVRTVRALLHGFVDLELRGGFGLPEPVDATFAYAVELTVAALTPPPRRARRGR